MPLFSVTYERWDESALEAGDTDDRGFVIQDVSLGDAMRLGLEYNHPKCGFSEPNDSRVEYARWLNFHKWNDGTHDYLWKLSHLAYSTKTDRFIFLTI